MAEYSSVPIEDPEKAQMLAADGGPSGGPPPEYEGCQGHHRCHHGGNGGGWARHWRRHCEGHGDIQLDGSHRRCRFHRIARIVFRIIFVLVLIHIIGHAIRHHYWHKFHHGRHGHHGFHHGRPGHHWRHGHHGHRGGEKGGWGRWEGMEEEAPMEYQEPEFEDDRDLMFSSVPAAFTPGRFPSFDGVDDEAEAFLGESMDRPRHPPHPRPPHRPPPACDADKLVPWGGPSKFSFDSDDFGILAFRQQGASDPGEIIIHQSANATEVTIDLTILVAEAAITSDVSVTVEEDTDHGAYIVNVRSPGRGVGKGCLKISVDITLPADLETFKTFIGSSTLDIKAESVSDIKFEGAVFHTFNGSVKVEDIRVGFGRFASVHGNVRGTVSTSDKAYFGAVKGMIDVDVEPEESDEGVIIKAKVGTGHVDLRVPGDSFSGPFRVATFSGKADVEAEDDDSLVVERSKRNVVEGYFSEKDTGSAIIVEGFRAKLNLAFV